MTASILDHRGQPIIRERRPRTDWRDLRARFDLAQTTNENRALWNHVDALGAAAALSASVRAVMRNRARHVVKNNSYASGIIRTLANDTVGTGPTLQMLSGDDEADAFVEAEFAAWTTAIGLADKLRTARMAMAVDGEVFGVFTSNLALQTTVKLDWRLLEAEQVAEESPIRTQAIESDGIRYDDFGNPIAYSILRQHPGENYYAGGANAADWAPAKSVIHLFRRERPGQIRGYPEITPAVQLFEVLRRYTLAVLGAAEVAADLAAVIETSALPEDPAEIEPLEEIDLPKRTMVTLPQGWRATQIKAEQPTNTYEAFKRCLLQEIARCVSMPYNIAAGDSSSYNYASGRLDHKTYYKSIRVVRSYLEAVCLDQIAARWWEEARLIRGYLPPAVAGEHQPPRHEWRWDGDEHVDPSKEASAQATALANGTTHRAREYAKLGLDVDAEDQAAARSYGVTVEEYRRRLFAKHLGAVQGAPANDPVDEDEEADRDAA